MNTPPELVLFFGRLHPLVVHLPIALLLLLALVEALSRLPRFRHANANAGIILTIAVPGAVLTAFCGWLLSLGGGYQDGLLQWHKWTGIATAGICVLAALLYRLDLRKPYRWALCFGSAVLLFASHLGGSLTHGSDYLVRYAPSPVRRWFSGASSLPKDSQNSNLNAEPSVFSAVVQPILQRNCVSCHGAEKSKGGLRLDSLPAMLKGGENGAAIAPGKPAETLLIKRVRLPLSDEDHMPPEGKPQLNGEDVALLEWWIEAGALTNASAAELKASPAIARMLQARLGIAAPVPLTAVPKPLAQVLPAAGNLGQELGIVLEGVSPSEPWLQCNASPAGTNFGDQELSRLVGLGPNLRWLDLGGTGVTDAGLAVLKQMPNLTKLHLERTAVTDAGLSHLRGLSNLEYLNLHHTGVTDAGMEVLQSLAGLQQLYLWGTTVTPGAAQAFAESRIDKGQIEKWREEIEELNARIRRTRVVVDLGAALPAATGTNVSPVNTVCPVSGKPIDAAKTLLQDAKVIAFCCDDCRAKFQQDPQAYLSKLPSSKPIEATVEPSK